MKVIQFTLDDVNYVNVFLAYEEATREAFLVDCGAFTKAMLQTIKDYDLQLQFLLLTHSHYDHVDGLKTFKRQFTVPVYAAKSDYGEKISAGETIAFAGTDIQVFETSGHTPDGLSFFVKDAVFVGDAIFSGAVGGTTSRDFYWQQNQHVAQKILTLPDETRIYCGHGAPSMVGVERLYNPFFT